MVDGDCVTGDCVCVCVCVGASRSPATTRWTTTTTTRTCSSSGFGFGFGLGTTRDGSFAASGAPAFTVAAETSNTSAGSPADGAFSFPPALDTPSATAKAAMPAAATMASWRGVIWAIPAFR